jgi:hypothetical protein
MAKILRKIVENTYVNLGAGIILLISSIAETVTEIREGNEIHLGAHHGLILFSLIHVIKILPDIFEGLEYVEHGAEKEN